MSKLLITGSSGFVGSNLIKHIHDKGMGEVESLNLRQPLPVSLPDFDVLIHLAGKAHDLKNVSDPKEYFDVNFGKTKQLFDLFLVSGGRDFIYFSTVKAAADTVDGVLDETNGNGKVVTAYGQSKQQAETYLLSRTLPKNKRLFILRPCMIHGPGNKGNLNLLYQFVRKGLPYPLAAFENRRSFLSVSNLNFILEKLISDPAIPGGIYNLADDDALSTNDVISLIAGELGKKSNLWRINATMVKGLARIGDVLHLPLNTERLKKLTESYVVSNQKIKQALRVQQLPVSSSGGLKTTIKSFNIAR
jgi:nucleoside-diphosphate-sugar epimerase